MLASKFLPIFPPLLQRRTTFGRAARVVSSLAWPDSRTARVTSEAGLRMLARDIQLLDLVPLSTFRRSPPTTTSTSPLPLPTPPEMSQEAEQQFDMITTLLGAGVLHIVEQILQSLDVKSLVMSEQVSSIWRDVIEDLHIWKHLIKNKIVYDPLWKALFKRRGWHKYLDLPPAEQISRQFYRQLHHSASRDIKSLETNWRRGHYTVTGVHTGGPVKLLQCDDSKIVTVLYGEMKIWDRSTLQVLKVLKDGVRCMQCNEEVVIYGSWDNTIKVWGIQTGQVINELPREVCSLKFTKDTLVTGSRDGAVALWNIKSLTDITLTMTRKGHKRTVLAVDVSETNVISGSADSTIMVWDKSTGELVRTLHGHSSAVRCLQLQGSHLISGSEDKTIRIWNSDTGECIRVLQGHNDWVCCVAVDNKRIVSGSLDKTIKVWDLAAALDTGPSNETFCITTLKEHTSYVYCLQFDDFQVISGSADETLLMLDFLDPTPPILGT